MHGLFIVHDGVNWRIGKNFAKTFQHPFGSPVLDQIIMDKSNTHIKIILNLKFEILNQYQILKLKNKFK